MPAPRSSGPRQRPPSKTPAERGEEFAATQRKLKDEAAARREAAAKAAEKDGKKG